MEFYIDKSHVSPAGERAAFAAILDAGMSTWCPPLPGPKVYTYWDYQQLRFQKGPWHAHRLRPRLARRWLRSDRRGHRPRGAQGKGASDHAPVIVELTDASSGSAASASRSPAGWRNASSARRMTRWAGRSGPPGGRARARVDTQPHAVEPGDPRSAGAIADPVVAYDQRGHESVPAASHHRSGCSVRTSRRSSTNAAAGAGWSWCGHSMGGMTVMAYAGLHPADVIARVAGVFLLGTAAADVRAPDGGQDRDGRQCRGPRSADPRGVFVTKRHQRHLNFGDDADPAMSRSCARRSRAPRSRDMGSISRPWGDGRASLAALATVPTTIMVGSKDRLTPPPYAYAARGGHPPGRR